MRVVRRRFTELPTNSKPDLELGVDAPTFVAPRLRSTDFVAESGIDTLTHRFRLLKDGQSLYPWSTTKLQIANGKRRWVAKQPDDYYDE